MAPRSEYANLDELKAFITMDVSVVDRDELLEIALDAAHDDLEADCGRRFYLDDEATPREFDRVVADNSGRQYLMVDDIGTLDGLVVETGTAGSWTTWTGTLGYAPANALAHGRAINSLFSVGGFWPTDGYSTTRVTARWGWPEVPPRVKQATLMQASRFYERRKSPQGVVGTADWGQIRVSRLDPDVFKLVSQLVRPGFGG